MGAPVPSQTLVSVPHIGAGWSSADLRRAIGAHMGRARVENAVLHIPGSGTMSEAKLRYAGRWLDCSVTRGDDHDTVYVAGFRIETKWWVGLPKYGPEPADPDEDW